MYAEVYHREHKNGTLHSQMIVKNKIVSVILIKNELECNKNSFNQKTIMNLEKQVDKYNNQLKS